MKRDIRTTLAIDGEQQFKKALSDAGRQMGVLSSESRAVSAAFGSNQSSAEALTAKNKILIKQIEQQEEIFNALASAVDESAAKYGEADQKTDSYRIKMNNAAASLEKMKGELTKNESALEQMATAEDKAGKEADQMGKQVKNAGDDTNNVKGQIKDFALSSVAQFASIAGAIAIAEQALKKMWETIAESARWAKELKNVSQTAGFAKDAYQEWDYILKDFGYSMEESSGDLAALAEKAMDAAAGAGEGAELFEKMGVKVTDNNGVLKTQEQLFEETIVALQGMTDVTERNAIASALMSTTGEKLIPILNMTADEVDGLKKEADEMGVVIGDGAVAQLNILQKELDKTAAVTEARGKRMSAAMASATSVIVKAWRDVTGAMDPYEMALNKLANASGLTEEQTAQVIDNGMLVLAVMENQGYTSEEVGRKWGELASVLVNEGVPAAQAQQEAIAMLTEGIDAQTYATEKMAEAQAAYDQTIQTAYENYTTLSEEYLAKVEERTAGYMSAMGGMFGAFPEKVKISGEELIANLESQVTGMSEWSADIKDLASRGLDEGLVQKLRELGPEAAGEVDALNSMTDEQLQTWADLYDEKGTLAKDSAVAALEPMSEEVSAALKEVEKAIADEDAAMRELGENLGKGIGDGLDDSTWYIKSAAVDAVEAAVAAAKRAADINSPSGLTHDEIGLNMGYGAGEGWIEGIEAMAPDIEAGFDDIVKKIGLSASRMEMQVTPVGAGRYAPGQTTVYQNFRFDNYSSRDGAAVARDLNRKLGYAYK